jgi:hypothetical protein
LREWVRRDFNYAHFPSAAAASCACASIAQTIHNAIAAMRVTDDCVQRLDATKSAIN